MKFVKIEGYSRYIISECGIVLDTKTNRLVSQVITGVPQYMYVNVWNDEGDRKLIRVHRLVALCYVENPSNFNIVDHIDGNRLNNHYLNLRWTTSTGNQKNRSDNWYIGDRLAIDIIYEKLGECQKTYRRIYQRVKKGGMDFWEALDMEITNI